MQISLWFLLILAVIVIEVINTWMLIKLRREKARLEADVKRLHEQTTDLLKGLKIAVSASEFVAEMEELEQTLEAVKQKLSTGHTLH